VITKIESIKSKMAEQLYLLDVLRMWKEVQDQGIDPEEVKSFGFSPQLLTPRQRADRTRELNWQRRDKYVETRTENGRQLLCPKIYNMVIMRDGRQLPLNPMVSRPADFEQK